jgi:2-(1,2-epoxy-1,2-dihydrophenyl)acetyl-CoA isomerase
MFKQILLSVENKVATITLNRPEVSNAFAQDSYTEIKQAIEECSANEVVGAIVLTGAGKNFSAGGDIQRFKQLIETKQYLQAIGVENAGKMGFAARSCPKPTIAMVNGAAAGAGCSLALACDFRIVTGSSKLAMSFINVGLSGDTGGLYYLQKIVGLAKASEMMMLGSPVGGEEAVRIGLATTLAEEGKLEEVTYKLAQKLANKPLFAIKRQKELMMEFFYGDLAAYSVKERDYMIECSMTADFAEATYAFLEKRAPKFQGK